MASISYSRDISAETENPHFLLTNKIGGFLALGNPNHSNYDGFYTKIEGTYYKILSNIAPLRATSHIDIKNSGVKRISEGATQELFFREKGILMKGDGEFLLSLDCKRIYDESDKGRIYKVSEKPARENAAPNTLGQIHIVNVCYTKYGDESLSSRQYDLHVAIATTMRVQMKNEWSRRNYPYDEWRKTSNTPWVYDLLMLSGSGTVAIAVGEQEYQAQRFAVELLTEHHVPLDVPTLPPMQQVTWQALSGLQTHTGIMAGLPWFYQEWSRDELISCVGLLIAKQYTQIIDILNKWYATVRDDGTLAAIYPSHGLSSVDAPGWLGKRTRDLLVALSNENMLFHLPNEMLLHWRDQTGLMIDRANVRMHDGLVWNAINTTWMDTASNDDGRAGARIEIQALFLALYDAHAHLCTLTKTSVERNRSEMAQQVISRVHEKFVVDGKLIDGLHMDGTPDLSVRPNIFIAWYIAPKLFAKEEWKQFFAQALPELWLAWGGLASIGVHDRNFHADYTGEDVASYHRGDSWYFVNNIAAMALREVGDDRDKEYADRIMDASIRDMLSQGYCGHCSELSSAAQQQAAGCHAQAWSAATLLEALQRQR